MGLMSGCCCSGGGLLDRGGSSAKRTFHVKILLLDRQEIIQEVRDSTRGQDLLDAVFRHLDLAETAYFGLRFQDNQSQTVSEKL